jgi:hypothetical protein
VLTLGTGNSAIGTDAVIIPAEKDVLTFVPLSLTTVFGPQLPHDIENLHGVA